MSDEYTEERSKSHNRVRERLEQLMVGNAEPLRRLNENRAGWALNLFQQAGGASGSFRGSARPYLGKPRERTDQEVTLAQELSRLESGRRARAQIRWYCATNALNRLGTLTYKGEGCHDPRLPRIHLGAFFRG